MHHIYLCECNSKTFITWTYSNHPRLWPVCIKSRFVLTRTVKIKGFCLQLKRSGTKYAAQKINIFNINSCEWPSTSSLWKVSPGSDKFLISYYLFIFSSHQHVQYITSQILLILIAVLPTFWSWTTLLQTFITLELEEISGNGKQWSKFLSFAALSNSGIKKTFDLYFNGWKLKAKFNVLHCKLEGVSVLSGKLGHSS